MVVYNDSYEILVAVSPYLKYSGDCLIMPPTVLPSLQYLKSSDLSEIDAKNHWFTYASSISLDFVDKVAHCLFIGKYIYTYLFI